MAKPFRTIKRSAATPTVSRVKLSEAVRSVAARTTRRDGIAPAVGTAVLRQPSVIVASAAAASTAAEPSRVTARPARAGR